MVEIEEISDDVAFERIGSHSHIRGLGLDDAGNAAAAGDGLVGQQRARESASHVERFSDVEQSAAELDAYEDEMLD